ncbi:MAG: hypothetical protein WC812_03955 [Candidatus Pacearchaeota archaeon]
MHIAYGVTGGNEEPAFWVYPWGGTVRVEKTVWPQAGQQVWVKVLSCSSPQQGYCNLHLDRRVWYPDQGPMGEPLLCLYGWIWCYTAGSILPQTGYTEAGYCVTE